MAEVATAAGMANASSAAGTACVMCAAKDWTTLGGGWAGRTIAWPGNLVVAQRRGASGAGVDVEAHAGRAAGRGMGVTDSGGTRTEAVCRGMSGSSERGARVLKCIRVL